MLNALLPPATDPSPIFELHRGEYATQLLVAAVHHLRVFDILAAGEITHDHAKAALGIAERPAQVLFTALRAFGLMVSTPTGSLALTPLAHEHLRQGAPFTIADYLGMVAESPGVLRMVECLRHDRPAGASAPTSTSAPAPAPAAGGKPASADGVAFIYRAGMESAMEKEASARRLTLALAGRARNVAPVLAQVLDLSGVDLVLDVGGGTGIYSIALLQKHPRLRAVVWDRPEVLKVAGEMARDYGVAQRLELRSGDMFSDEVPRGAQAILLSNVLHDWDVPECQVLLSRLASALAPGGRLHIHDVFLSDALDGPLPIALYSAALFALTQGRAYSAREYRQMLGHVGLNAGPVTPTLVHCGILSGSR